MPGAPQPASCFLGASESSLWVRELSPRWSSPGPQGVEWDMATDHGVALSLFIAGSVRIILTRRVC